MGEVGLVMMELVGESGCGGCGGQGGVAPTGLAGLFVVGGLTRPVSVGH